MVAANRGETLTDNTRKLYNVTEEAVESGKQDLQEIAGKAGRRVRQMLHNAGDDLQHAKETISEQVHEKPVQSSLVALGIGIVLGALLRR